MASIYANLLERKKALTQEKSSTPFAGVGLEHQRGRRFIVLDAATSLESALNERLPQAVFTFMGFFSRKRITI